MGNLSCDPCANHIHNFGIWLECGRVMSPKCECPLSVCIVSFSEMPIASNSVPLYAVKSTINNSVGRYIGSTIETIDDL